VENFCNCVHFLVKRVYSGYPALECSDALTIRGESPVQNYNIKEYKLRYFKGTMVLAQTTCCM
jgi:hypothetical protein